MEYPLINSCYWVKIKGHNKFIIHQSPVSSGPARIDIASHVRRLVVSGIICDMLLRDRMSAVTLSRWEFNPCRGNVIGGREQKPSAAHQPQVLDAQGVSTVLHAHPDRYDCRGGEDVISGESISLLKVAR